VLGAGPRDPPCTVVLNYGRISSVGRAASIILSSAGSWQQGVARFPNDAFRSRTLRMQLRDPLEVHLRESCDSCRVPRWRQLAAAEAAGSRQQLAAGGWPDLPPQRGVLDRVGHVFLRSQHLLPCILPRPV
jgi:hypothetical protein